LRMFSSYRPLLQAMESDELSFARMGPAPYLELLEKGGGSSLLAMQDHKTPLSLAIFVRRDGAIAKRYLADTDTPLLLLLVNQSMALGETNSTTGYHVACWYLVSQGIYATYFATNAQFAGQQRVIDAVIKGEAAVGVGNLDLVDDHPELLVIAKHKLKGDLGLCWVAGRRLDPTITKELRECLLELKGKAILGKLESEVKGFKNLNPQAVEWLLDEMRRDPKPYFKGPLP